MRTFLQAGALLLSLSATAPSPGVNQIVPVSPSFSVNAAPRPDPGDRSVPESAATLPLLAMALSVLMLTRGRFNRPFHT